MTPQTYTLGPVSEEDLKTLREVREGAEEEVASAVHAFDQQQFGLQLAALDRLLSTAQLAKPITLNDLYPGSGPLQEAMEAVHEVLDLQLDDEHDVNCRITPQGTAPECTCGLTRHHEQQHDDLDAALLALIRVLPAQSVSTPLPATPTVEGGRRTISDECSDCTVPDICRQQGRCARYVIPTQPKEAGESLGGDARCDDFGEVGTTTPEPDKVFDLEIVASGTPAGRPSDPPAEGEPPDLGAECEYGCRGRCEDLAHWKDRALHWFNVAESGYDLADVLRAEGARINAAANTLGDSAVRHNGYWCRVPFDLLDALLDACGLKTTYHREPGPEALSTHPTQEGSDG